MDQRQQREQVRGVRLGQRPSGGGSRCVGWRVAEYPEGALEQVDEATMLAGPESVR